MKSDKKLIFWPIFILVGLAMLAVFIGLSCYFWLNLPFSGRFQQETPPSPEALQKLGLKPAWHYETEGRIRRIVGSIDNKLILYSQGLTGQFVGIDIVSGKPAWQYQAPGAITNLETRDELLLKDELLVFTCFTGGGHRSLIVLDAATGQELWHLNDEETNSVAGATFAVGDDYIYWAIRPYYLAFDRYTGHLMWQSELTIPNGYSGLLYDGADLIVIRPDIYVLDANTGQTKRNLTIKINSTPSKIRDGIIYVEKDESNLIRALDARSDTVLWEKKYAFLSNPSWTPLVRANRIYFGLNGSIGALDAKSGEVIWGKPTLDRNEAIVYSNPAFVGDTIYTIFSDGSLRTFSDRDGTELGRVEFKAATRDAAVYGTDDMLFVSFGSSSVYAYTIFNK